MKWRVDYEYQYNGMAFFGSMVAEAHQAKYAKLMIGSVITRFRPNVRELCMTAIPATQIDMAVLGLPESTGPGRMD